MMQKIILLSILGIDVAILFFQIPSLSISAHEATILYGNFSIVQFLSNNSLELFGNNDLALRIPMMLLHLLSVVLIYLLSRRYLSDFRNRVWLLVFFILSPGVFSSALLVDSAGVIIFCLLLFAYFYEYFGKFYTYPLLLIYPFVDGGFVYLFLSLALFSWYKKDINYLVLNLFLLGASIFLHGVQIEGSPEGHFLDSIGLYAAIFTPVIFVYVVYVLYRRLLSRNINVLWFISVTPLILSLLLSFRQEIVIEVFAPYLILALPLAAQTFYASYRVRLKMFRKSYKSIFAFSVSLLVLNFVVVLFHQELYLFIENPKKHFARKMHIAKELSSELKNNGISCISTTDKMGLRLKFYGVESCNEYILEEIALNDTSEESVTIGYKYRTIYKATVTNINTK